MKNIIAIRQAQAADAADIAGLIYSTSLACCFTPEQPCPDWYRDSVQPAQIARLLGTESINCLLAFQERTLAGVLALGDKCHVKYFFVAPARQKLGIGKQLWHFALHNGMLGNPLTVRSSLFAVPVYARLGFTATEPARTFNGLHYQTMVANYG